MHGPDLLIRTLSRSTRGSWQYNSRSDRHSKVACWGILFDLLLESPLLRRHCEQGKIVFGVNHEMGDFKQNRHKYLDLVLATPRDSLRGRSFSDLIDKYDIDLSAEQREALSDLPVMREANVGSVRIALEAKACMTAHLKALPRLFDELNSSHLTIHGADSNAIAVGFVMINFADTFVSSIRNPDRVRPFKVTIHPQPKAAVRTIKKIEQLPRRTRRAEEGFDAVGVVAVNMRNDDSNVELVTSHPALPTKSLFTYDSMIQRTASLYASRYSDP